MRGHGLRYVLHPLRRLRYVEYVLVGIPKATLCEIPYLFIETVKRSLRDLLFSSRNLPLP